MGSFDYSKAAGIITGVGGNPILDAVGTQFGVPSCMMDFAKDVLAAFPSPVLNSMEDGLQEGKALADSVFKDAMAKIRLDTGIVEYDTTLGRFVFVSSSSNKGVEQNMLQGLNDLQGLGTILGFGAEAWVIGENVMAQIDTIKNCINKLTSFGALQKGPSAMADKLVGFTAIDPATGETIVFPPPPPAAQASSEIYDASISTLELAGGFVAAADRQLQLIKEVKQARQADPANNPEPVFWNNMEKDGQTLGAALSGLTSFKLVDAEADANGNPIIPQIGDPFNPFVDVINASGMLPPLSQAGQFLFSKTGIYYDSYGGGLEFSGCISNIVNAMYYDASGEPRPGVGVPPDALKWLMEYNPNIGGKGEQVSWNTFNKWANTAFNIDNINESPQVQQFYEGDHFLQVLIDQRNREIYDLSSYIGDLQTSGYPEDSALLSNQRQVLYSKIASHDLKIKKRKKQIEVYIFLSPLNNPAVIGEIPINNFEGLDGGLLAIEKQKQEHLLFNPGEVSGVVLPLCPTFIKSEIPQDNFTVEELMVPPVGIGQIITSDPPFLGTSGTVLSLTDQIDVSRIATVYNFLDADIVLPSSDRYLAINCATSSTTEGAAQITASSIPSMFPSGVGVPYFRGVCNFFSGANNDGNPKAEFYKENAEYLHSAYRPYSYSKLPVGYAPIDDLLYSSSGATFDFWTHVPDLHDATGPGWDGDSQLSSLHRVVMGCENRGGTFSSTNENWEAGPFGSNVVKGLLMGFTRDCRITSGTAPSNLPADNDITKGLSFHMSPTQSINTSGITFLTASANVANCPQDITPASGYYGIAVETSAQTGTGTSFDDCSSAFIHTTVTIDYGSDLVSIYLNGDLLTTSSVTDTFGENKPPQIPSMIDTSSFFYNTQWNQEGAVGNLPPNAPLFPPNSLGYTDFWNWEGPEPLSAGMGVALTPWIVGGGYSDGMHCRDWNSYSNGSIEGMNFMGGKWGGKKSGLFGYIGSLKLYNKALTSAEASQNYNAQKGFFTNIRTYTY